MSRLSEVITRHPLFDSLSSHQLKELEPYLLIRNFKNGETIQKEGVKSHYISYILTGEVKASKLNASGKAVTVRVLKEKSILCGGCNGLGYVTILTARALGEVELLCLSEDSLKLLEDKYPRIALKVYKAILSFTFNVLHQISSEISNRNE